jgi:hypothetical protein
VAGGALPDQPTGQIQGTRPAVLGVRPAGRTPTRSSQLCFRDPATGQHRPYQGHGAGGQYAGHYWGWTYDLVRRIRQHRNPQWNGPGRLVKVALADGLTFELAYLEYPATPGREHRLKRQGSAYRRCPLCRGTGTPLDPAALVAAVAAGLGGEEPS